jgi:hypothetical protein
MATTLPPRALATWLWPAVAWSLVGMAAVGGLAWRDCLMLAAAAWLSTLVFEAQMARRMPWQAWRAGVRCASAGLLLLVLGLALVLAMVFALEGSWQPGRPHPMAMAALALAAAGVCLAQRGPVRGHPLARLLLASAVLAGALWLDAQGTAAVPCVTGIAVGVLVAAFGWRLLRAAGACWGVDQGR